VLTQHYFELALKLDSHAKFRALKFVFYQSLLAVKHVLLNGMNRRQIAPHTVSDSGARRFRVA
jgi:hypothetical protein